ncbi:uncharacterized protein EAF01_005723 [Botrytis porri]|uniref:Uncharacterized protein n=1 Tax=Botrytis porri TaxID=87229 RepID=A0A4Z1KMJ2_9HELO|nr:uncharacterized protein EAF01_005723 [Botrytis porri]KAF7905202.1 hypothetical protein EAF01_005723 [Botrytis porri]TGO84824.1 hypothetical protein BPOR_0461g00050 [Botrytis porri]
MTQPWATLEADEAQFTTVAYSTRNQTPYNGAGLEVYDKSRPIQIEGKRIFGVLRKTVVMVVSVFLMVVCVIIGIAVGVSASKGHRTSQSDVAAGSNTTAIKSTIPPSETPIIQSATDSELLVTAPTGS